MRSATLFMPVLLILLVLPAGCGADPSVRVGAWQGSTQYGDFTLYISEDGTTIKDVSYSVRCGDNWTDDSNFNMGDSYPIEGRKLDFGVWLAGQVPLVIWKGEFSSDGKTLSGELRLFGNSCVTSFKITR